MKVKLRFYQQKFVPGRSRLESFSMHVNSFLHYTIYYFKTISSVFFSVKGIK